MIEALDWWLAEHALPRWARDVVTGLVGVIAAVICILILLAGIFVIGVGCMWIAYGVSLVAAHLQWLVPPFACGVCSLPS